jgi:hypothetical protein
MKRTNSRVVTDSGYCRGLERFAVSFPVRNGMARADGWYVAAKPRRGAVILVQEPNTGKEEGNRIPLSELARSLQAAGLSTLLLDAGARGGMWLRPSRPAAERQDVQGAMDYLFERGYAPEGVLVYGEATGVARAGEGTVSAHHMHSVIEHFVQALGRPRAVRAAYCEPTPMAPELSLRCPGDLVAGGAG